MLRVIAGSVGGLPLRSPKGADLRPTQDRVKQAMFSSLGDAVVDANVLDLYSGTGALGIEALSRGAASAVFVEKQRACAACVKENLLKTKLTGEVVLDDSIRFLERSEGRKFSLVFADPPYDKSVGNLDEHPLGVLVRKRVDIGAIFVWEQFHKQRCEKPLGWDLIQRKVYGETALAFLRAI